MLQRALIRLLATSVLLTSIFAGRADAQAGFITGTAHDIDGKPIPNAMITAENALIQRTVETTANAAGRFSFVGLQRGRWLFTIQALGFRPVGGFAFSPRRAGLYRFVRAGANAGQLEFVMEADPLHPPPPPWGLLAGIRADELEDAIDAADQLLARGDFDDAIAAYEAMLERVPHLTSLHLQIGHAHRERQDFEKALTAYRAVPENDPAGVEARAAISALEAGRRDR